MEKLREYRLKNKFTNQLMADILGISKPYYWQIEHDQKRLSYDMAIKIADIFHLKPDDLFYDEFKESKVWFLFNLFDILIGIYIHYYSSSLQIYYLFL